MVENKFFELLWYYEQVVFARELDFRFLFDEAVVDDSLVSSWGIN